MSLKLHELLDLNCDQELTDESKEFLAEEIPKKIDKYILMFDHNAREIDRLSGLSKAINKKVNSLKSEDKRARNRLLDLMKQFGFQNLKGDLGTVALSSLADELYVSDSLYKSDEDVSKVLGEDTKGKYWDVEIKETVKLKREKIMEVIKSGELKLEGVSVVKDRKTINIPKIDTSLEL